MAKQKSTALVTFDDLVRWDSAANQVAVWQQQRKREREREDEFLLTVAILGLAFLVAFCIHKIKTGSR